MNDYIDIVEIEVVEFNNGDRFYFLYLRFLRVIKIELNCVIEMMLGREKVYEFRIMVYLNVVWEFV